MFILKLMIIGALIQIMENSKPYWSALIYAFMYFVLAMFVGVEFSVLVIYCPIKFILALIYFWLLQQSVEGFLWWLIAIVGFFLLV